MISDIVIHYCAPISDIGFQYYATISDICIQNCQDFKIGIQWYANLV